MGPWPCAIFRILWNILIINFHLYVQRTPRLAPEPSHLVKEPLGSLTDQNPHSLPVFLNLPGDVDGVRHDAVVWHLSSHHNTNGRSAGDSKGCIETIRAEYMKLWLRTSRRQTCWSPSWCWAWCSAGGQSGRRRCWPAGPGQGWQSPLRAGLRCLVASRTPPWSHPPLSRRCTRWKERSCCRGWCRTYSWTPVAEWG